MNYAPPCEAEARSAPPLLSLCSRKETPPAGLRGLPIRQFERHAVLVNFFLWCEIHYLLLVAGSLICYRVVFPRTLLRTILFL